MATQPTGFGRFSQKAAEKKAERAATEPPSTTPQQFNQMMNGDPKPAAGSAPAAAAKPAAQTRAVALGGMKANLLAVIAKQDEGGGNNAPFELFPTLQITGGNGGGQMIPTKATVSGYADIAGKLPQGKQTVEGIVMSVRAEAIAWPRDYDSREEGEKPTLSCAIRLDDADTLGLLLTGSENFQFCPKDQKASKWYAPAGGPGSLRPVFQALVWLPTLQMPVVLQAAPLLKTFREMAGQISQFVDGEKGELSPIPVKLEPTTDIWYDKNFYHYWKASVWADAAGKQAYTAYGQWAASVVQDRPDLAQTVSDWVAGVDKPITEDGLARLKWAAQAVNPRRRG